MTDRISTSPAKTPWTTPALARLDSRDAELGANPNNPEGPIATGS